MGPVIDTNYYPPNDFLADFADLPAFIYAKIMAHP
jgi:hypothetical protein